MVSAKYDMQALERSLKKAAGAFGETSAQAVIRWGVSVCRDLAVQTQAFGQTKTKVKQENSITAGARSVVVIVPRVGASNKKGLRTSNEVNAWIESTRGQNGRTPKNMPFSERKVCTEATFQKAMRDRFKLAGIAKGAWIGAGQEIAKHQTGQDRIAIGKNFLGYSQKHASRGHGVPAKSGFSPVAILQNNSAHSASPWVLKESSKKSAVAFGARKTIKWYNIALKKSLNKV